MISLGIFICTIISGKEVKSTQPIRADSVPTTPWDDLFWWIFGIALLTLALFVSARMGIYQEVLYKRYGKHANEALYYTVRISIIENIHGMEPIRKEVKMKNLVYVF